MRTHSILLAMAIIAVPACSHEAKTKMSSNNGPIVVTLNGKVDSVEGVQWPVGMLEWTSIDGPTEITVQLPSKKRLFSHARLVILDQKAGSVTAVTISPLDELVTFHEAVRYVKEVANQLGIANKPSVARELLAWQAQVPAFSVSLGGVIEERVDLFVELKPHGSGRGWYVSMTFYYLDEEHWNLLKDP
jgi:hypothetical protein